MSNNYLFDVSKLDKRKTPQQEEFEQSNFDLLIKFRETVSTSFDRKNKIVNLIPETHRDKNLDADLISGYMKGDMQNVFPEKCGKATPSRFAMTGNADESIYLKKLDANKRPCNIKTKSNEMIVGQYTDNKDDTGANIFLGYTSDDMTSPTGIYAVCIDGETTLWESDLMNLTRNTTQEPKLQSDVPTIQLKPGVVKLKENKKNG